MREVSLSVLVLSFLLGFLVIGPLLGRLFGW